MRVYLIGCGCGPQTLTREAAEALQNAELVIGAGRLLAGIETGGEKREAVCPDAIEALLRASGAESACVLFSGDSGFYSGARLLLPRLADLNVRVLPGVSSLQALAARLGRPWQDWTLCSAHGVDCDAAAALAGGKACFFLTGGKTGPAELCKTITALGLGELPVTVGENLYGEQERILRGSAAELAERDFAPLSVLLCEAAERLARRVPGLPDEAFERLEGVPMSKQELRALALAKLGVGPEDLCWDIGAGSGSVSVELALQAREVWAVEREAEALALAARNRERFRVWNLHLLPGEAPEALAAFPKPDAVFVGGSGGRLEAILHAVHGANPAARVCVSAIALETLETAARVLEALNYETEVTQLAVSRSRKLGKLHMMMAQNAVWLITGKPK